MCFDFIINNIFYGSFYCLTYFLRKDWNDLLRRSGLVRASNALSVIVFLVLGAILGMMSVRSEIEFRRMICLFSCFSVAGRSSGLSGEALLLVIGVEVDIFG